LSCHTPEVNEPLTPESKLDKSKAKLSNCGEAPEDIDGMEMSDKNSVQLGSMSGKSKADSDMDRASQE
jgi:hypothetical protein